MGGFHHQDGNGFIRTNAPRSVYDRRLIYDTKVLQMKQLTQDVLFVSVSSVTETHIVDFRTLLVTCEDKPFMTIARFGRAGFTRLADAIAFRDKCLLERGFVAVDGLSDSSGLRKFEIPIGVYGIQEVGPNV